MEKKQKRSAEAKKEKKWDQTFKYRLITPMNNKRSAPTRDRGNCLGPAGIYTWYKMSHLISVIATGTKLLPILY